MPLEQATEIGAIEAAQARGLRDRAARALHHTEEVATLELGRDEVLGIRQRHRHQGVFIIELGSRGGRGSLVDEGELIGGKYELLHVDEYCGPRADYPILQDRDR